MSLMGTTGSSELRQLQERLRRQHNKHLAVAEQIARALESLDEAIAFLELEENATVSDSDRIYMPSRLSGPSGPTSTPIRSTGWTGRLQGLTQMEALIVIAEYNGGLVKATEARDILVRAGLAKGQLKNVATTVHHLLGGSDEFEKLGPGLYRLKTIRRAGGGGQPESEAPSAEDDAQKDVVVLRPITVMSPRTITEVPREVKRPTLSWDDDLDATRIGSDASYQAPTHNQGGDTPRGLALGERFQPEASQEEDDRRRVAPSWAFRSDVSH